MKVKLYALLFVCCVLVSGATAAVAVRFSRFWGVEFLAINPATGCSGADCCSSGSVCLYRDEADNKLKLHRADDSILVVGEELVAEAPHGTLRIGLTDTSSDSMSWLRFTPDIGTNQPWGCTFYQVQNTGDSTYNQINACGWNVGSSAQPIVANKAQVGISTEQSYRPSSDPPATEMHAFMNPDSGPSDRVITMTQNRTTGDSLLQLLANAGTMGRINETATFNWNIGGTGTLSGPNGQNRLYVDDNQWILYAGNTTVLTSGGTDVQVPINTSLGASAPTYGSGTRIVYIGNASAVPTNNPSSGGFLFVDSGTLKYRGPSGTVTPLANP